MHETLELKEEEIAQLRSRIKQMTTQGEELREQKEKSERAGKNTEVYTLDHLRIRGVS